MASYVAPTNTEIKDWTGLNTSALGLSSADLETLLSGLKTLAEADISQQTGESRFESTSLSTKDAVTLKEAVAFGTAWRFLQRCMLQKTDGTHEPLLVEESERIGDVILYFKGEATRLALQVAAGEAIGVNRYQHAFADGDDRVFNRVPDTPQW